MMALLLGHLPHPDREFHRRPEVIEFVLTLKVMGFDHFPTRLQLAVQDFLLGRGEGRNPPTTGDAVALGQIFHVRPG
jgi:hypothetical protein